MWREIAAAPRLAIGAMAGSALLGAALGQAAYYVALRHTDASRVVPVVAAYPLVAVLLAALLVHETLTWPKLLGAALIVGGVALIKIWG